MYYIITPSILDVFDIKERLGHTIYTRKKQKKKHEKIHIRNRFEVCICTLDVHAIAQY